MAPDPSRGAWLYAGLVWSLALVLGVAGHRAAPLTDDALVPLVALLLLGGLARLLPDSVVSLTGDGVRFSFFGIVILAAAVLVGPIGAALVGIVGTIARPMRSPAVRRVFNAGMFGVVGLVGGLAYNAAGGLDPLTVAGTRDVLLGIGLPLVIADLTQAATNAVLLSGVMVVTARVSFWAQMRNLLASTGPAYVGYGVVAFLLVVLWGPGQITWFAAILTVVPLGVAWWVFGQFGAELQAHERTTDTLIAALDARHPGAGAHAQRVAILCDWIGESLRVGPKALAELRTAGLLHDVGLVRATEGDTHELRGHPVTAVRILTNISFAVPVLPAIGAHHERIDGSGYPRGLLGPEIPFGARVLAVADAFDALTAGTPDHPAVSPRAALDELRSDGGLDGTVVAALGRAAERHGILDQPGPEWLTHSRIGQRRSDYESLTEHPSIAAIVSELTTQSAVEHSWILAHDHPAERLGG
ncbi:MAG TPA: HD domain-containing protein [Intrasporangiaceae bacterium]|nr:HD domain-containing protein [Intrasporangiaceae bacterium]